MKNRVSLVNASVAYRYGFNGMEKDDEMKGSGNSYDFGARIYDSRLGRWLAVDPQFRKQSGWSTYKAFLDNPIFYVDPEGETEYSTVIRINKKTGKTTIEVAKFNRIMTDGEIKSRKTLLCGSYWEVDYYDYKSLTIITTDKNGVKDSDSFNRGDDCDTKVDWGIDISRSGIHFTLSYGKGEGRRTASYDVETVDLDLLLAVFGATKAASGSGTKSIFDAFAKVLDAIQIVEDVKNATKSESNNKSNSNISNSSSSLEVDTCATCKDFFMKGTHKKVTPKDSTGRGVKKTGQTNPSEHE